MYAANGLPWHLSLIRYVFLIFTNRCLCIFLSISTLLISYGFDVYFGEPNYFSRCSGILTVLGLVLTIKHSYLSNIRDLNSLISSSFKEAECTPSAKEMAENPDTMRILYSRATDEGLGLILIVVGTLFAVVGPSIPLVSISFPG